MFKRDEKLSTISTKQIETEVSRGAFVEPRRTRFGAHFFRRTKSEEEQPSTQLLKDLLVWERGPNDIGPGVLASFRPAGGP